MGDLLFRQCLEEKLKDISGFLKTGRGSFSFNSKLYKNLNNELENVLDFLDEHSGEEDLSPEDKKTLEEKIHLMKVAAKPYMLDKIARGALTYEAPDYLQKRFRAAYEILQVDSQIPVNPGEEHGIIPPVQLEPGDKPETDWRLKWKQNVRYLAKKQIATYEKKYRELDNSELLQQDEFDALMELMDTDKLLTYKDDAQLCQRYPNMRIMLEKAVRANEKLQNMKDEDLTGYLFIWEKTAKDKAINAVKKSIERSGRSFTENDRKKEEEKLTFLIKSKSKEYRNIDKLTAKGDELEQVARFLDLKMKVISDKNYVKPIKKLGVITTADDCEKIAALNEDKKEQEFYRNLRDIRELENAGIFHKKKAFGIDKAFYRNIDERAYTTVKKEFLGFRIGKPGFKGIAAINDSYGADKNSTVHTMRYGGGMKLRVGKIGLKLHTKSKSIKLSGGIAFGQVKSSATIGTSYVAPNQDAILAGEASAIRARIKLSGGNDTVNASIGAGANVGYCFGALKAGLGNITIKDKNGKERKAYGIEGTAGAIATAFKGGGSGSINILGVSVSVSVSGYAAGIGGEVGGHLSLGSAKFSLAGALGIGAGLSVSINWTDAIDRVKKLWQGSKLKKLIQKHKEKKKEKKKVKDNSRYEVKLDKEPIVRGKLKKKPEKDSLMDLIDDINPGPLTAPEPDKKPDNQTVKKADILEASRKTIKSGIIKK